MELHIGLGVQRIGRLKYLVQAGGLQLSETDQISLYHGDKFYITYNGRKLGLGAFVAEGAILNVVPRLPGGKGGFGSMLRAIGAQIEKTTNREACRDLSGRRLRDINEEKRLKNWINNKAELEKERKEKRRKKLEKMVQEPKVEFKDSKYEEARSEMTEKVSDALEQGLKASSSAGPSGSKRPSSDKEVAKLKKKKIWGMDDDLSDSDEDSSSEGEGAASKSKSDGSSSSDAKSSGEDKLCDPVPASELSQDKKGVAAS